MECFGLSNIVVTIFLPVLLFLSKKGMTRHFQARSKMSQKIKESDKFLKIFLYITKANNKAISAIPDLLKANNPNYKTGQTHSILNK